MDPMVLLNNVWLRYVAILLVGITVGAVFYPTKHIEEKISQKYEQEISSLKETHQKEMDTENLRFNAFAGEMHAYHDESEKKISTLTTKVHELQSSKKTSYFKVIHPDGTIEIKQFSDTEVKESDKVVTQIQEEFKQKVDSIEKKWKSIHETRVVEIQKSFDSKESDYKKTIEELQKSKSVTVNEKKFSLEAGMMSDRDYYVHAGMDLWGPVFVGLHGESNQELKDNRVGLGLGLRF